MTSSRASGCSCTESTRAPRQERRHDGCQRLERDTQQQFHSSLGRLCRMSGKTIDAEARVPYIIGLGRPRTQVACGVDGTQALVLAIEPLRVEGEWPCSSTFATLREASAVHPR